jgi:hypothetical protein
MSAALGLVERHRLPTVYPFRYFAARATASLHVRYDERADRAANNAPSEAHMAVFVLTRLYLLTLEQVAGRDVAPA